MIPTPIKPTHRLINQYPIVFHKPNINNNDATKYNESVSKDPLNQCSDCSKNNKMIIGGVIITVLLLIYRKNR